MTKKTKNHRGPKNIPDPAVARLPRYLRAFADFERHIVAFLEVVEVNSDELARVEEEILVTAFLGNESESPVCESLDCSLCHFDIVQIN